MYPKINLAAKRYTMYNLKIIVSWDETGHAITRYYIHTLVNNTSHHFLNRFPPILWASCRNIGNEVT